MDTGPEHWRQGPPASVAYSRGTPQAVLDDVVVIPFNDVDGAVSLIRAHADELACVLIDPLPNRAGLVPADRAYVQALRSVTAELGILLVFDEVISFRLGHGGAQGLWGVEADLSTFAKIIGGGFPVGATGGRREVMAVFDPREGKPAVPGGGTFSANPVTMRAGLAAMELLDDAAFARLDALGERFRTEAAAAFRDAGLPGTVTGLGSLARLHFTGREVRDYRSATPDPAERRRFDAFLPALVNEGVIISGNGMVALSTAMTEGDLSDVLAAVRAALLAVARG